VTFRHTSYWITAGAALGLLAAVFAGVAAAATPGPIGRPAAPAISVAAQTAAATSTTTAGSKSSASPGATPSAGVSAMMSQMLVDLSPQARAEFQTLYPQMIQLMDSSHMMSGTGAGGSMMDQPIIGSGPASTP
jgi:hypothetical protein